MAEDPHQGGRLEDMAATGTTIPGDAGQQRIIPSVPRPDQIDPSPADSHPNSAHAADNAFDIARGTADQGVTGEIMSGTGHQLPSAIEKKTFDDAGLDPGSKGHDRAYKRGKQADEFDTKAEKGHGVQAAPGEENDTQEELLERRGAQ